MAVFVRFRVFSKSSKKNAFIHTKSSNEAGAIHSQKDFEKGESLAGRKDRKRTKHITKSTTT